MIEMKIPLRIEPFSIHARVEGNEERSFYESIFSQGNGYIGVRGYDPLQPKQNSCERSVFAAGVFEQIKPGITDMVNLPDIFSAKVEIGAQEIEADLSLNMENGLLVKNAQWQTSCGDRIKVQWKRMISMANTHGAAMQIIITPLDADLLCSVETGIDGDVANLPISDDQMTGNLAVHRLLKPLKVEAQGLGGSLVTKTAYSGRPIMQAFQTKVNVPIKVDTVVLPQGYTGIRFSGMIEKGKSLVLEKAIATYTYRDQGASIDTAKELAALMMAEGFDSLAAKSAQAFQSKWDICDIEIEGEAELQGAIRYNIFQLLQNNAADDSMASIGARGLMHGRYKGNYFWDTEIFMLPFYLYTNPQSAKNLLLYRYNTLKDAKIGAKTMSLDGARYPWMCSDTGFEQCETWDTGCCEIHITADIAYALINYVDITGDDLFYQTVCAEMLVETARYWMSRLTYHQAEDVYNLLFVKGPDEYCGVTLNNTYTNYLVKENLYNAFLVCETLQQHHLDEWNSLVQRTNITYEELLGFKMASQKVKILYDEGKSLYIQDEMFDKMEPLDIDRHKQGDVPLYRTMSYDRLQRYKVIKQADLVLLMTLYRNCFTQRQKEKVWQTYEPITLHDSTLSFGVHSQLAFQLKDKEKGMDYFQKSVYLDLCNIMDNTHSEGIHMAALGASWQAIVFGMAGLEVNGETLTVTPCLPDGITSLQFRCVVKGDTYQIKIKNDASEISKCNS